MTQFSVLVSALPALTLQPLTFDTTKLDRHATIRRMPKMAANIQHSEMSHFSSTRATHTQKVVVVLF